MTLNIVEPGTSKIIDDLTRRALRLERKLGDHELACSACLFGEACPDGLALERELAGIYASRLNLTTPIASRGQR